MYFLSSIIEAHSTAERSPALSYGHGTLGTLVIGKTRNSFRNITNYCICLHRHVDSLCLVFGITVVTCDMAFVDPWFIGQNTSLDSLNKVLIFSGIGTPLRAATAPKTCKAREKFTCDPVGRRILHGAPEIKVQDTSSNNLVTVNLCAFFSTSLQLLPLISLYPFIRNSSLHHRYHSILEGWNPLALSSEPIGGPHRELGSGCIPHLVAGRKSQYPSSRWKSCSGGYAFGSKGTTGT